MSDKGEAYEGKGVTDGKLDNGWLEGDDSRKAWGSSISAAKRSSPDSKIRNYTDPPRLLDGHNRAKEIEVEFDGSKETFTLADEMKPTRSASRLRRPPRPSRSSSRACTGKHFNDTGFSEIQVMDNSPRHS